MRNKSLILTSLLALGLAGTAGAATTTKPAAAPMKTAKVAAKADAKEDKIEATSARKVKMAKAYSQHKKAKVATKTVKASAKHG